MVKGFSDNEVKNNTQNTQIKPKKGLLIGWNNLYSNGFPNYKTMHEALPPLKGDKYIITKWWRSWSLI